jgi:hypothetical protein
MNAPYHTTTTVLPGQKIEITAPQFHEGDRVEVIVVPAPAEGEKRPSALDVIESYKGPVVFGSVEAIDRHIHEERDSWE